MDGEPCASSHVTQIPIAASLRRRRPLQQARRRGPGVLFNQSINQSIFRIDMLVLQSFYKFLVHSYDFRKICWPDVRRGNRFDCEYLMIWSFQ